MKSSFPRPLTHCVQIGAAVILVTAALLLVTDSAKSKTWSLKVGTGYEFISQEYFFDSLVDVGADSLLSNWALETIYLDDFRARIALDYRPREGAQETLLGASFEQSSEFIRARARSLIRSNLGESRLKFDGELESRSRYRGVSEFGENYIRGYGKIRITSPISNSVSWSSQMTLDGVQFQDPSSYQYNYTRIGGSLEFERLFPDFSFATVSASLQARIVPDTSELSYVNTGLELSYYGFYDQGNLDFSARLERKNYRQDDDQDDHYRFDLSGHNRTGLGGFWFARQEMDFELVAFSPEDPVNFDYTRFGLGASFGLEFGGTTLALGPAIERLAEEKAELEGNENYWEYGAVFGFDYIDAGRAFVSTQSDLGLRELGSESEFQSGFIYYRLTTLGDIAIASALSFNLLFSAEWEWHDASEENSRLYLFTSSLTYTF